MAGQSCKGHLQSTVWPNALRGSEPHLLSGECEVFGDIREKYGELKDDESLVRFFKEVLERRDLIDEAEKEYASKDN